MIDSIQRAHERLLATLPVHTHLRADQPPRVWGGARVKKYSQLALPTNTGLPRPIMLDGIRYASVKEAARKLLRTDTCIANRIKRGLGWYCDQVKGAQTRAAVLSLLKRGTPTRRIAVMLGISRTAVQKHMRAAGIKSLNKAGYSGKGVYGAR